MISYITGVVEFIDNDKVIVDNNGIGYGIFMPSNSLDNIGIGEKVKIFTYFNVKEDAMQLYGFFYREELNIFKLLIGVSGVGPKGAINIISACPGDTLHMAIISDDSKMISKAQGIGAKTAQRIIIELKDKIKIEEVIGVKNDNDFSHKAKGVQADAIEALVSLGYSQSDAYAAVKRVGDIENMDVEELLKNALKNII